MLLLFADLSPYGPVGEGASRHSDIAVSEGQPRVSEDTFSRVLRFLKNEEKSS